MILGLLVLSGCSSILQNEDKSQEDPQLVAERFARFWEQKDWNSMYDLFTPELQAMKTQQQFYDMAQYKNKEGTIVVRLDKISNDSSTVIYAYYSGSLGAIELKMPAAKMVLVNNSWRFDAFAEYFSQNLEELKYTDFIDPIINGQLKVIKDLSSGLELDNIYIINSACSDLRGIESSFEAGKKDYSDKKSIGYIEETNGWLNKYCDSYNKISDFYFVSNALKSTNQTIINK